MEKKSRTSRFFTSRQFFLTVCIVPTFLLFVVFMLYPIVDLIRVSFYSWDGLLGNMKFIGLKNYETMFKNTAFWTSFRNTVFFIVFCTLITVFLSLFLATVLSKSKVKHKAFYRVVFYFPNILSIVVISGIFNGIFSPENGVLNSFLSLVGLDFMRHNWMADSSTVNWCLVFVMVWQAVGYYMVMYVAGMDSIPVDLYEVADLEGATGMQKFMKITLPMTWEVIRVTLTFFVISTINMS
ncbi:MAG: sugar ABC transporter permease, partial [Ruthenibacterium sp.]